MRLNHYLLKPWEPAQENLFPILRDELADWQANTPPEFVGIKVIGTRFNADSHRVKDFLARNSFPYMWMDIESEIEACRIYTGQGKPHLPLVILEDDERLENPTTETLAEKLGLQTRATGEFYDFVVVGAGPAGLAAAVYAASEGLKVIEREAPGGQAGTSSKIENYLGFPEGLSGKDLARRALAQAQRFGVEFVAGEVDGMEVDNQYRRVHLANGAIVSCHALLLGEQLDALAALGRQLLERAAKTERLSSLERSDREAKLSDWMFERDFPCADEWAVALLGAGVSPSELDEWERGFGADALEAVVGWMVGNLSLEETANAISEATRRIGDIVERVKKYSHLDQSPLGSFQVREGVETTLKMLAHKLRPIKIEWDWPADLPNLYGYEGELNQVWTNLLDNAADALVDTPNPRIDSNRARLIALSLCLILPLRAPISRRVFAPCARIPKLWLKA